MKVYAIWYESCFNKSERLFSIYATEEAATARLEKLREEDPELVAWISEEEVLL